MFLEKEISEMDLVLLCFVVVLVSLRYLGVVVIFNVFPLETTFWTISFFLSVSYLEIQWKSVGLEN